MRSTSPLLPGRLGTPGMALADDPRADPRMLAAMAPFGLTAAPGPSPVDAVRSVDGTPLGPRWTPPG